MEILRSGKRALLIPRAGPSAEQRMRARLFAAHGWVETIDPADLSSEIVASAVVESLGRGPKIDSPTRPDMRGLTVAAEQLLALLPPISPEDAPILDLPLKLEQAEPIMVPRSA